MEHCICGQAAQIFVQMKRDGQSVAIAPTSSVSVGLYADNGIKVLVADQAVQFTDNGNDWARGVVAHNFTEQDLATAGSFMLVVKSSQPALIKRFELLIEPSDAPIRSLLFIKDTAVERLRADTLMLAAGATLKAQNISDDFLWQKLRAAESEMAHELRVPLVPTVFSPQAPTELELAALNGQPWGIDPGYDYEAKNFQFSDKWGFLKIRNKPLQTVSKVRFAYPGGQTAHYDLPLDWLRLDSKSGTVQFVPSSSAFAAPLNAFVMQAIGSGRSIPLAIELTYVAGLVDAKNNYPELIDVIFKKAALKILEGLFAPQSGSISADGLSQSMSMDIAKHHETIDVILNGPKGSNGGLMASIHGIRLGVLGA